MQKQLCISPFFSSSQLAGNSPSDLYFEVENKVILIKRKLLQEKLQVLESMLYTHNPHRPEALITRELVQQEHAKIQEQISQLPQRVNAVSNRSSAMIDIPRMPLTSPTRFTKEEIDRRASSNRKPVICMLDGGESAVPPPAPDEVHCPVVSGRVNRTTWGQSPKPSLEGHRDYSYNPEYSRESEEYGFYFYTNYKESEYEPNYDRSYEVSNSFLISSPGKSPQPAPKRKNRIKRSNSKPHKRASKKRVSDSTSSYNPVSTPVPSSTPIIIQVPSYPIYSPVSYNYSPYYYPYSNYHYAQYSTSSTSPQHSFQPEHLKSRSTSTKETLESGIQCSMLSQEDLNQSSNIGNSRLTVPKESQIRSKRFEYSYLPEKRDVSVEIVPTLEISSQYPEPDIVITPRDPWAGSYGPLKNKKLADIFHDNMPEAFNSMKEREETLEKSMHKDKSNQELLELRKEMLLAPSSKSRKLIQTSK
jgi:hypothetical protein